MPTRPSAAAAGGAPSSWPAASVQRGHEVRVVQPRPGRTRGVTERVYDGITVIEVGSWAPSVPFLRNYFKNERLHVRLGRLLADLARQHRVDVLHGQHVLSAPAAVEAGRLSARPVVCTVRDYWPVCYWSDLIHDPDADGLCPACSPAMMTRCVRPRSRAWPLALPLIPYMRGNLARKRRALARASVVIAVSSAIARDLRQRAPEVGGGRLETIPNPVDVDAIRQVAAERGRPSELPYAVFAGKLEINKGVRHLVPRPRRGPRPAVPLVVRRRRVAARRRRGRGAPARRGRACAGLAPARGGAGLARPRVLRVFPSHGPESLSRVLLEAGALGVPAAAMDTGGTRDIVVQE